MTNKKIVLGAVVGVVIVAITLGIVVWPRSKKVAPANQTSANQAEATGPEVVVPPSVQLSRVRLLISNLN